MHFVKTGRLDPDDARLVAGLQKYRVEADHSAEFVLTKDALEEDLAACSAFVQRVRGVIPHEHLDAIRPASGWPTGTTLVGCRMRLVTD